jgi:transposase
MANIHKKSLQEELERLKGDFSRLSKGKAMSPEITVLMNSMFMLMELICAIFLEKNTKKTKDNSSIPPSQSEKDDTSLPDKGSKGKGKKENDKLADNCRTRETVTISPVDTCSVCGEDLSSASCCGHERRTKIDIIFEKVVKHVDAEIKICASCQSTSKGLFPGDMPGPLQYGAGMKAFTINLIICQMVALNRVQKTIRAMVGQTISEATLLKYILHLHWALASWEENAIDGLLNSAVIHVDETSLRVDKKNHWIHVYASNDITLKCLHRRRGKEAIEHINIVPRYSGVIIHDCWASYFSYENCGHGLCGSHLLRELTFIVQANDYRWAANLKALLKDACKTVARSKQKKLTVAEYATLQRRYRNILTRGGSELPEIPPKPSGQRGNMAKSDARNLWERLYKHEEAVLLFAKDSNVAFTNNRAERDLRMAKVKQKVSGCFRNTEYAHAYCRISSYIQTMANKGYNPLIAIQMALAGNIDG